MYKYKVYAMCIVDVKYSHGITLNNKNKFKKIIDDFNIDTLQEYFYYSTENNVLKNLYHTNITFYMKDNKLTHYIMSYIMTSSDNNKLELFKWLLEESSFDINNIFDFDCIEENEFYEGTNINSIKIKSISLKYTIST